MGLLARQEASFANWESFTVAAVRGFGPVASEVVSMGNRDSLGSVTQNQLALHQEQYRHNRGYTYSIIRTIAQRAAGQKLVVGKKDKQNNAKMERFYQKCKNNPTYLEKRVPSILKDHVDNPDSVVLREHRLIDVLNRPNKTMVAYTLWYVTCQNLDITGKAFWWMIKKEDSESGCDEIWPLPSSWVQPIHEKRKFFAAWKVTPYGSTESFMLPGNAIAPFSIPDPEDPLSAISPMQAMGRTVMADEYIEIANGKSFVNGCNPGLALFVGKLPETTGIQNDARPVLTKEQRNKLINAVKAQYRGVLAMDEPLILDGLITDVKKVTTTPREMDFLNSGKATKSRLAQGWGVNPISMGEMENANRASSQAADQHLCDNVVNPRLEWIGQTLTYWVAPFFAGEGEELFAYLEKAVSKDIDFERTLENDMTDRSQMTINERRRRNGMEPLDFGDGQDRIVVSGALVPIRVQVNEQVQSDPHDLDNDGIRSIVHRWFDKDYKTIAGVIGVDGILEVWDNHQRAQESVLKDEVHRYFVALGGHLRNVFSACMTSNGILTNSHVDFVYDDSQFLEKFKKAIKPQLLNIAMAGAAFHWNIHRPVKDVRVQLKSITDWIRELPGRVSQRVTTFIERLMERPYWAKIIQGIKDRLRGSVDRQRQEGNSGTQATDAAIDAVLGLEAAEEMAQGIAVTESVTALNGGQNEVMAVFGSVGVEQKRMWKTVGDDRVRPDHKRAEGQVRGMNEPFNVGGEAAQYPGDPSLSPAQRCGCRCTTVLVLPSGG